MLRPSRPNPVCDVSRDNSGAGEAIGYEYAREPAEYRSGAGVPGRTARKRHFQRWFRQKFSRCTACGAPQLAMFEISAASGAASRLSSIAAVTTQGECLTMIS